MENFFALTDQQKNVWNSEMFYSGTNINNIGGYLLIKENVNFSLLEKAANIYIQNNEAIRYHFNINDNEPVQFLTDYSYFKLNVISVENMDGLKKLTSEAVSKPFNIINNNLYKFILFNLPNGNGGIIPVFHHLIADAWGLSLFINEIIDIYTKLLNNSDDFISYPSYSEYIISCSEYENSNKYLKDKDFWENTFNVSPELTYISKKKDNIESKASRKICSFDSVFYNSVLSYCKEHKSSVYTFFMAIFSIYLSKINNTSSAILGTPVLNRSNFKEKNTSGMFVSTVPFKINIDSNLNFIDFLGKVSLMQTSIFRHQKYPYLKLLSEIKEKYNISENLYDFVLSYQNARDNKNESQINFESFWEPVSHIGDSIQAHFYDMDSTGIPFIYYDYQTSKFSEKDIELLHNRIMNMAEQVLSNPFIKDISIISKEDECIINKLNDSHYDYDKTEALTNIFQKQVASFPEKPAIIFKSSSISYKELDEKSNKIANFLLSKNVEKNDVVGVMFHRGLDILPTIWGILKTGASYLLIDPSLPEDRIQYMLTNARAKLVITNLYLNYISYNLDSINYYSDKCPNIESSNDNRFCVIYTSGSTGTPKGVELKRIGVINMLNSYKQILKTSECERFLSTSTVAFDMFIVENFVSILDGKTVVLADEDEQKVPAFTCKLIENNNVDFILSTPSKISLLLEEPSCLKNVKVIQLGGEVFKPTLYNELKKYTSARIYNGYGPSECTACASNKLVTNDKITIGKPFLNTNIFIMNKDNNVLPPNYPGEIVIKGDGVGKGYINKYDFNGVYHTGDLGIISNSGELIYLGRKDNQIKLHGLRIELDEITSKIMKIKNISNAITVIKKVNDIDCICSYIIGDSSLKESYVKSILYKSLPKYMVPAHIVFIDSFPITLNGKIDVKNLPEIVSEEIEYIPCSTETEKNIENILKHIFNKKQISAVSNFFDLGADSLATIRLVSEIYSKLKIKIDIQDIYTYPTICDLAKYIDTLDSSDALENDQNTIQKRKPASSYPVTSAQRRIFYTVNMQEHNLAYNTPFGIVFNKKPDISKVESCISTILNSHDAFKTYFELENGDVVQKLVDNIDFHLQINNYKNENFIQPFDLSIAPLVHIELDCYDNTYLLQLDFHHIICDGTSINVFAKELCDLYNGNAIKKSKYDYIDYSLSEKMTSSDKEFWISAFTNGIPLLNMPTEFERSSTKSFEGSNVYEKLNNASQIIELCKKLNVTPYMFLLSCFYIVLYKYTMQNNIVVGTPVVGRNNPDLSNVIGMFVNTLPLKQNIQSTNKFSDFLNLVKNNCLNCFNHQTYPFDEIVKNLNIPRDPSRNPMFDVMFIYESGGRPNFSIDNTDVSFVIPENNTSKFDFSLEVTPTLENFELRLEYCAKLFGKNFMETFLQCYVNIINTVIDNIDIQISKINMLSEIPYIYPTLDYPKDLRIIDLFENQVKLTPNKVALVFENEQYTYEELEIKVNKLANYLRTFGKNEVMGIMMDRSSELIISILAVLKSGAGYLPIDPTYPEDRIKYIIDDSHVKYILTEEKYVSMCPVQSILVDNLNSYQKYEKFDTNQTPNDISYMIYTSGSTGRPKGVMLKQSSVVNFIYAMCDRMPLKDKTVVSITTMCFDIFVFESLLPLCTGMKVVMASNEEQNNPILLNKLCLKNNVQVIQTTPSKFKLLMTDNPEYLKHLDVISLAGEPFPLDLLNSIRKVSPARVFNMYGPTETTVGSTLKELTNSKNITIGTPLANTHILVLDNDMNFVPYNVPGMLYIGGDGVSIGYMNNPNLTAKRYLDYNGEKIYNSGDLVKLLPNGELECLGRSDFQVKVRGLRIELGEIENAICAYKGVKEAVVTVKKVNERDILCGYFVADGRVPYSTLKKNLSKKLPNYMVPSYLLQIETFAFTPNGKIDRKALPDPVFGAKEIVPPRNDLESKILEIWRTILSIDQISIDDNFFEIGGDSLFALKMQVELMKLNYNINYGDIFKNNTIRDLANFIENQDKELLAPIYKKQDFKNINKVLKKNSTFKPLKLKQKTIKNILLVGATGFLGIHVLAELLKLDDIKIYCLIRKDPSTSPENKLKRKFQYYFGSDLSNLFGTRLFVIAGDITLPNFNTSKDVYEFLGNEVSSVVNCAASVKHYGNYADFEKINVTGVKNLVEFCENYNKEFYQTSTISVSGNTMTSLPSSYSPKKKIFFGENNLFINQPLNNVYVRSKFEAEKFVLEEISKNKLKGLILRIGNITNRYSDGKFQDNSFDNAFLNRLKAFMYLKEIPNSIMQNYIEFSPVDKIAESIVISMKYYTDPMSVLHLYNSNHIYIDKFISILNELGIIINVVDDQSFKKDLNNLLFNNNYSDRVSVLLNDLDKNKNLVYKTNLKITNNFTLKFLDKADFYWPEITKEYIAKILKNL